MKISNYDVVIHTGDAWDEIVTYEIHNIINGEYIISPNNPPGKITRKISAVESHMLFIYPFSFFTRDRYEETAMRMERVCDMVCALLQKHEILGLEELIIFISGQKEKYQINNYKDIEWILRCLTAAKVIVATCKKDKISFTLSPSRIAREKSRKFAATVASELTSLSERIRTIINHAPTVGTYRENILQNSLRKHLPERYHVATGFILGLDRQIDILIYDRVDYAPLFREGDLVIVPPESVRAVIEVKTKLTSQNLYSALALLSLTSKLDDNQPPFFRGVFAFESSMKSDVIYQKISDFYTDLNTMSQGGPGELICRPFNHLTCACVVAESFSYVSYARNERRRLVPVLRSKMSISGLESQSSLFMQSLLSHLKFGGIKKSKINYMGRMLGEDTLSNKIKDLREGDDSWGAYYSFDEGDVDEDVVEKMENLIISVQLWLDGEENFEALPST